MDCLSYSSCNQCPRNCDINRFKGLGFCLEPEKLRLASACLHFGEEPPVTGKGGSGTIFVTGCNLRCAFCQNYQISQKGMGKEVSSVEFAEICLKLQKLGAENINIVTGSHVVPAIIDGLKIARDKGMILPVCWNSSAYEKTETLSELKNYVDIWLPDFKTINEFVSQSVFKAKDYPEKAKEAILFMLENSPLQMDSGKMLKGVIVRHLFLPGRLEDTILTLEWLKKNVDGKAFISLMSQYTPVPFQEDENSLQKRKESLSVIENRLVSDTEFQDLQDLLEVYDFQNLFYQELEQSTEWLPDFNKIQPFSNDLAKPVWHWKNGFV